MGDVPLLHVLQWYLQSERHGRDMGTTSDCAASPPRARPLTLLEIDYGLARSTREESGDISQQARNLSDRQKAA